MKQIHYAAIVTVLGLVAFVTVSRMIPSKSQPKIYIMGTQQCCDTDDQVDVHPTDSIGILEIDPIDTLQNVSDLLFYLEGIPSFEEID